MTLTQISTAGVKDDAVTSGKIPADAIGSSEIAANAVGSSELADDAVDTAAIVNDAVTSAKIADNAVVTAAINADAVTSAKIADNAVVTAAINADAVTGAKIADDAIDSEHYADGSIDTAHIADGQITSAKIADNAVTLAKMAGGTDGQIITYDASGNPVAVGPGNDGQVLTSTGAGSPPAFEDAAGGKILKIENFVYKSSASTTSSSNSYVATPLTCTITPSAANSKIYLAYSIIIGPGSGYRSGAAVYRDINSGGFSQLAGLQHDVNGSNQRLSNITNGANQWTPQTVSNTYVDSPSYSVGNTISYKLYLWAESNGTLWINRISANDSTSDSYSVGVSTMTLMEIAA